MRQLYDSEECEKKVNGRDNNYFLPYLTHNVYTGSEIRRSLHKKTRQKNLWQSSTFHQYISDIFHVKHFHDFMLAACGNCF